MSDEEQNEEQEQELEESDVNDTAQEGQGENTEEPETTYEMTPEDATSFSGAPAWFDRKKVMLVIACSLSVIVLLGFIFSSKNSKKKEAATDTAWAANVPKDFLQRELNNSLASPSQESRPPEIDSFAADSPTTDQYGLPLVTSAGNGRSTVTYAEPQIQYPQQQQQQQSTQQREPQPQLSPLVPKVEGSIFASQAAPQQQAADPYAALLGQTANPYAALLGDQGSNPYAALLGQGGLPASLAGLSQQDPYAVQNDQAGKNSFYSAASKGTIAGNFLQGNLLWIGTIIPAVLETAINTDLPGNVIARVTENVYDSQSGKNILIPQGTILIAQYNSSVSYQQHRIQIVWDILIRPDGYQIELEGMNAVDPRGIAGLKAVYHENWFEYIKAAGIVSLFSLINSKMVEEVAKYSSNEMASGVITSNAEFIKDIGGNLISRALNIQPTLTVDSGEKINIMLNKNIYLPPFRNFEVTQRYILK